MSASCHRRCVWIGQLLRPAWHLRGCWRNADYCALLRYAYELSGMPRGGGRIISYAGRQRELSDGPSFRGAWDGVFVNRLYAILMSPGRGPILVDAGLRIGLASIYLEWSYGDLVCIEFEPGPRAVAVCLWIESWRVGGELHELVESDGEGRRRFLSNVAGGGRLVAEGAEGQRVKTGRLSASSRETVDPLKVDVEGAESAVLRGITPYLPRIRHLFMEWHQRSGDGGLGAAIQVLEGAGFDCHMQVAQGQRQPFMSIEPSGEFSQNVNIYAVRP